MALPPPFVSSGFTQSLVPSPSFDLTLQLLAQNPKTAMLDVLVIDLTTQPKASPAGFGTLGVLNGGRPRYAASTVKVAAMFAAYRLRKSLIEAGLQAQANTPDELVAEIQADWGPIIAKTMPGQDDFPKLKQIFDISGSNRAWKIDFTSKYRAHMHEMIHPSENHDASVCILALGYKYIQGALKVRGVLHPRRRGHLPRR